MSAAMAGFLIGGVMGGCFGFILAAVFYTGAQAEARDTSARLRRIEPDEIDVESAA